LNSNGNIKPGRNQKLTQIQRFREILKNLITNSMSLDSKESIKVVDIGSGKGYLTFGIHELLNEMFGSRRIETIGIEMRTDLVELTNTVSEKVGFAPNLKFIDSNIVEYKSMMNECDVLIALHACDTATDEALYAGIQSGASIIVSAPCCHKQVRKEIEMLTKDEYSSNVLLSTFRHGILMERECEIVTDSIRAMVLEACGYKASVFEFISNEHTAKNVLITAVKRKENQKGISNAWNNVDELLEFYKIRNQRLVQLVRNAK